MSKTEQIKAGDSPLLTYTFGTLTLTFKGLGIRFLSDKTKEIIAAMSVADAKAANKDAWRQLNKMRKVANRHSNWSNSGNIGIYEKSYAHESAAEAVTKETYKRMTRG